jgi:uncharacterized protein DUF1524/excalibur calcium-binding domain-containing protein
MSGFVCFTIGGPLMSSPHQSAIEELLSSWEAKNPGTPVRPVVQQAVDVGFTVGPPAGWGPTRHLRLVYEPQSGSAVTFHVDAHRLTAVGAAGGDSATAVPGAVVRRKDVQFPFDAVDSADVLGVLSDATVEKRQISRMTVVRAAVAALMLALVVAGAATGGFPGVLMTVGFVVLLVGIGAVVVGQARWALIASRGVAAGVLAAGVVVLLIGGATAPATEPVANTTSAEPTATPTISAADVEAATVAAEAALLQAETAETVAAGQATTGLLADSAATTAIESAQPTTALAALAAVPVQGRAAKTGYDRDLFGSGWVDIDRNGCDTRNDMLGRDLTAETFKSGTRNCVVLTGSLADPYSGQAIGFQRGQDTSADVQIDHVVALSNSWQTGAQGWDAGRRAYFANDPLNLLAVDGPLNMQKGDGDAATWLPPNKGYRCAYVARQVAVKVTYGLWMTQAERNAIATVLSACPNEPLPGGVVADVPVRTPAAATTAAPAPRTTATPEPAPVVVVPVPAPAPDPEPAPAPVVVPEPEPEPAADVYYANCDAVKAAGAAPIYPGDPGFEPKFDRDDDGVGCES